MMLVALENPKGQRSRSIRFAFCRFAFQQRKVRYTQPVLKTVPTLLFASASYARSRSKGQYQRHSASAAAVHRHVFVTSADIVKR